MGRLEQTEIAFDNQNGSDYAQNSVNDEKNAVTVMNEMVTGWIRIWVGAKGVQCNSVPEGKECSKAPKQKAFLLGSPIGRKGEVSCNDVCSHDGRKIKKR